MNFDELINSTFFFDKFHKDGPEPTMYDIFSIFFNRGSAEIYVASRGGSGHCLVGQAQGGF